MNKWSKLQECSVLYRVEECMSLIESGSIHAVESHTAHVPKVRLLKHLTCDPERERGKQTLYMFFLKV